MILMYVLQITIKWPGHFANEFHRLHKLLNEIDPNVTDVILEDTTGQPPYKRSMEAIPNVNGITHYQVAARVDQDGGNTTFDPPDTWQDVDKWLVSQYLK